MAHDAIINHSARGKPVADVTCLRELIGFPNLASDLFFDFPLAPGPLKLEGGELKNRLKAL